MIGKIVFGAAVYVIPLQAPLAFAQEGPAAEAAAEAAPETVISAEDAAAMEAARKEFEASLVKRTGQVALPAAHVTLNVPEGFYFLDKSDAHDVLVDAWGNPPDSSADGMLFPASASPLDGSSWGVVLTFDDTGHVSDEEANKIDYDSLIEEMREGQAEENKLRAKDNYEPITIVRWAATPRYDAPTHKLLWAKELQFGEDPAHTLNYDMRVLGRNGVLSLNFVAGVEQLQEIESASAAVLSIPNFDEGYRYEDFDPKTDKKADFGIMGLIAGGAAGGLLLAKKGGLLALGLVILKKAGVFIVAGLAAAGAGIKKFFGGNKDKGPGA